ncbi:MAG: NAD(P)-dependent oxidoreductase [Alphaproteobacteria bacterium]
MRYFPIFVDLKDRTVLIVGSGEAALQKARLVTKSDARIEIIAPDFGGQTGRALHAMARSGRTILHTRRFVARDVAGAALVYAATGDAAQDAAIADAAKRRQVPVNVVDNAQRSTFITPAIVDRAPVVVAIGTEGAAPVLARVIKARIEAMLPAKLGATARAAARFRQRLAALLPAPRDRRHFWAAVFSTFDHPQNAFFVRARLENLASNPSRATGQVTFVGVGPGDPDLLVHKARRILDSADVVFHPSDLAPAILDLARREARFVAYAPLESLSGALARAARAGNHVVSLLPGAGLGGETATTLSTAGIGVDFIPGLAASQPIFTPTQIAEIAA